MSLNWEAAERLRGDQVEDQIEFGRLLDRDADRLRPAQKLVVSGLSRSLRSS
jgi:hypothetical protein